MLPKKSIRFSIETFEDMLRNKHTTLLHELIGSLLEDGYEIDIYRNVETLTTIKDLKHYVNFLKANHFDLPK